MSIQRWGHNFRNRLQKIGLGGTIKFYFATIISIFKLDLLILKILPYLPVGNILTFECENDMQDNARALYEYLYANGYQKRYMMVWVVKDVEYCQKRYTRKRVRFITRNTTNVYEKIVFNYYISRTKFFFFTHPYWLKDWKKGQTVLHLCHGAPPFKGRDINRKGRLGSAFNYILAPSKHVVPWECDFWGCNEDQAIILGAPRNDWVFQGDYQKFLNIFIDKKDNEKVIMVMPTFRQTKGWVDSEVVDRFSLNVVETLKEMEELNSMLSSSGVHILVKIHPLQNLDVIDKTNYSHIHYLSNADMYAQDVSVDELMGCCDAIITDFSSVYMEFLLLDRPVAFFINSTIDYKRSYIMDNPEDYMPGEKISNFDELKLFITHLVNGEDNYVQERKRINDLINTYQDNQNCKRLAEYLSL